jgi:hypothetical protein
VIPDDLLQAGAGVLTDLAHAEDSLLTPCPNPADCFDTAPNRPTPPPSIHSHLEDSDISVGIYLQRDTLWFLPPLNSSSDRLLSPKMQQLPSQFVLASDQTTLPPPRPGRASSYFQPGRSPVVVPKAHVLLEAFMRIYARDVETIIGSFAMSMIAYMVMYVDEDGFLDVDQLPEPLKELYCKRWDGTRPLRHWTQELIEALGQKHSQELGR